MSADRKMKQLTTEQLIETAIRTVEQMSEHGKAKLREKLRKPLTHTTVDD